MSFGDGFKKIKLKSAPNQHIFIIIKYLWYHEENIHEDNRIHNVPSIHICSVFLYGHSTHTTNYTMYSGWLDFSTFRGCCISYRSLPPDYRWWKRWIRKPRYQKSWTPRWNLWGITALAHEGAELFLFFWSCISFCVIFCQKRDPQIPFFITLITANVIILFDWAWLLVKDKNLLYFGF